MERRIQVLPDHVANQIAAGEVVERPASVVKELVENALDAGSRRIAVVVEEGGKRLIRVTDDGVGMSSEDALCALQRHATSKVRCVADLKTIASLGFRGEALPSIRSVSRFRLRTRLHSAVEGVTIAASGAQEPVVEPCGCPPGTEITVADLFHNVPARRKFLRRTGTEMSRISSLVDQLALGRPEVHFTLHHNGRRVSDYPADRDLVSRILAVLGRDACRRLYPVRLVVGELEVSGYAGDPSWARPSSKGLFTFVNGRFVRDRVLAHAVTRAYADLLDRGRHPVGVLFVTVPPESVDVNVHPAKAEVRFVESGAVHGLVERALRLMLLDTPWTGFSETPSGRSTIEPRSLPLFGAPDTAVAQEAETPATPAGSAPAEPDRPTLGEAAGAFDALECLGQVGGYLLLAGPEERLMVIDAAAARARVAEHDLVAQFASGGIASAGLLFPESIRLSADHAAVATRHADRIRELGFELDPFGGDDWIVGAIPRALVGANAGALIVGLLDALATPGGGTEAALVARLATFAGPEEDPAALLEALDRRGIEPEPAFAVSRSAADLAGWFAKR